MAFKAKIIGIPHIPTITQVNIRKEANKKTDLLFKIAVGTNNLDVVDVKADLENEAMAGKVFQWFKLVFADGQQGWCRDDLISIQGDGRQFGYGQVATATTAFNITRQEVAVAVPAPIPVSVAPEPTTPDPAVTAHQSDNSSPGMIICMGKTGVNVRPGPGVSTGAPLLRMPFKGEASILNVSDSRDNNDTFKWVNINYQGQQGWVREDFTRLKGNFEEHGLAFHDMYPSPAPESWWIRDFNLDPNFNPVLHHGWDHAGNLGAPINAGPNGGKVLKVAFCQKCGAGGASAVDRGFSLSSSSVLGDPAWNFGYGHYVIVTYLHDKLPKSTQDRLTAQGREGWHISVMYAHLQSMLVQPNQELESNTQVGTLGNSGNSSGPHLHLEVRAHANANETQWANMKSGLMSPSILFLR